ncbi:MAG TPA: DNA polymerase III subunit delta [Acidimicrobiales bacterium]|jgi:DNA polymerase-3 subunit delta|nr:DNA polymerase III subunit delta [Acidimicrobiales bacterium]
MAKDRQAPVTLLRGDEPSLVRDAVIALVDDLVGDADRSLMVEEVDVAGDTADERAAQLRALVDAAQTPPFLTDRRVVVGRGLHAAKADELAGLSAVVAAPLDGTYVVLTWESGAVPKRLLDALKSGGGEQVDVSPGRNAKAWVNEHLAAAGLQLDSAARELLVDRLGEDVARLRGVIEALLATFGAKVSLSADDIEPYVGEPGALAPWALTDAIDKGAIPEALDRLRRMLGPGERGALQIMGSLNGHYSRMLALEGAGARDQNDAAALLGMRGSTFPAKKALDQSRRLGHDGIVQAFTLLAQADRDLRGERAYPREIADELVMEMLVARLANLSRLAR